MVFGVPLIAKGGEDNSTDYSIVYGYFGTDTYNSRNVVILWTPNLQHFATGGGFKESANASVAVDVAMWEHHGASMSQHVPAGNLT